MLVDVILCADAMSIALLHSAELAKRLAEIDLTNGQANIYSQYYNSVQSHVNQLVSFLDSTCLASIEHTFVRFLLSHY